MRSLNPDTTKTMKSARLRVWRGTAPENGRYQEFDVPFEDGDSVLDALVRIRMTDDPDLAFQFSCFNANVCKECAMLINGTVEYACIAKLIAGTIQVDPIPDQRILRDLLIDTREREQKGADLRRQMRSIAKDGI
jgi:succinate dehydrogenase / fumarate reductase iron-sulfur subunit